MSFKDEYEKLQRQIAPDEKFIGRLTEKLQKEKQIKKSKNKARLRTIILSASATCAAAAAALVIVVSRPAAVTRDPDILNVGADKIDRIDGLFTPSGAMPDTVSPAELADILYDEDSTIYGSEKTVFDFDDKLDYDRCRELAARVANAENTESAPNGRAVNYMAVSEDGKIVKFSVSGSILEISGVRYAI